MSEKIVIIGTGLAGYAVAKEFRKYDDKTEVTMITKDDGCYYSKPLLSTSFSRKKTPDNIAAHQVDDMKRELKVNILTETEVVSAKEKELSLSNGEKVEYTKLVIACGAVPNKPDFDITSEKIFQVNNLDDYKKFYKYIMDKKRNRIMILGGGLVGCEFANDLLENKMKISLVSRSMYLIEHLLPEKISEFLAQNLQHAGVKIYNGMDIKKIEDIDKQLKITLSNNVTTEVDSLLVSIGLKTNTKLAETMGIKVNNGIVVNEYLETSMNDVYAIGDCAEVCGYSLRYIKPMMCSAIALGKTLAGEKTGVIYDSFPISIKTPVYPISLSTPNININGKWHVKSAGMHIKALRLDKEDNLIGFAVTGDWIKDKLGLLQSLPNLI